MSSNMSLRSKIAWYLSPNTTKVASEKAQNDGFLSRIFDKLDNEEELTRNDEIKLNSYYKQIWETVGTEEFSNACKEAAEIVRQYNELGIDCIQDAGIRQIIEEVDL